MWRIPAPLISAGATITAVINADVLIGNLWTYLGSPSGNQNVLLVVDGADAGDVQITPDWGGGSTFQITCVNGGRILGLGGSGGSGGADYGSYGTSGIAGGDGSSAITATGAFIVNVNIDDGFLLGGGGGGGGGGYQDLGANGIPGSGGGGGQGFSPTAGGLAGAPSGTPVGSPGLGGTKNSAGSGGFGALDNATSGGPGGTFGSGGQFGNSVHPSLAINVAGDGGRAGRAFYEINGTLNLNGSKTEAVLRTENRIKGEIGGLSTTVNLSNSSFGLPFLQFVDDLGALTIGLSFNSDGNMTKVNTLGDSAVTEAWLGPGSVAGDADDYEIRIRDGGVGGESVDQVGTWDASPGAAGTWFPLSTTRAYTFTGSTFRITSAVIEFKHNTQIEVNEIVDSVRINVTRNPIP